MKIYTVGFTKKSAEQFFQILSKNKVEYLIDIRLHPGGQLAGFTKKDDLRYFLKVINGCSYRHMPNLAPEDDILKAYREDHNWEKYKSLFEALMDRRGIPATIDQTLFEEKVCCLLCSEPTPEQCHRKLVAERLARCWKGVEIVHI
jgi:uncharacterized protein (DUF488 family)